MKKALVISTAIILGLAAPAMAGRSGGDGDRGGSRPGDDWAKSCESSFHCKDQSDDRYSRDSKEWDKDCDDDPSVVPLPASLPLAAGGFALMGFIGRRRKKA